MVGTLLQKNTQAHSYPNDFLKEVSNANVESFATNNVAVSVQALVEVVTRAKSGTVEENITVTNPLRENSGQNQHPRIVVMQLLVIVGWPPHGLPLGYTVTGYVPPRFGNSSSFGVNPGPPVYSEFSRDYQMGSTSNASNSIAAFRQHVNESHHDLVNLLTQQMTTILNPIMADHETRFERLARQVERIARVVNYDKGGR
ncbi:hypothetical protein Ahy_A09g044103 isoform B [Arachis hypogaea]|uniref:Uncharacterized protein n=1 Tax=Arachis hypogaea TaxID=3818 RepID=A0A445BJI9_ARAHY|nr:hypothetical protein Ahy_A09g044103 isoform B [Arachis hypogaea]